jgi:hypothetical protein
MHSFFSHNNALIPFDRSAVNSFVLNVEMRVWDSRFVMLEAGYTCGR